MDSKKDEYETIFVASFWHKWAKKRIYARSLGLKAIPIRVRTRKRKQKG